MNERQFFQELGKQIYRMDAMYANYAKRLNLKSTTLLWVLYALDDGTDHSQKEISVNWHIPKSSVNAAISELDEQGFVTFLPIQGEKRELLVRLTPSGEEYAHRMLAGDMTSSMIDLDAVMKDKATGYAELAALRSVSLLEKAGQSEEAMALLYEIRGTKDFSAPARNVATVAIAQRLMDAENPDYAEVEKLLAPLAAEGSAWKDIAGEILAAIPD